MSTTTGERSTSRQQQRAERRRGLSRWLPFACRAGQPISQTPVRFVQLPERMTDLLYGESSVLGTMGVTWITVTGYSLNLPIIMSGY